MSDEYKFGSPQEPGDIGEGGGGDGETEDPDDPSTADITIADMTLDVGPTYGTVTAVIESSLSDSNTANVDIAFTTREQGTKQTIADTSKSVQVSTNSSAEIEAEVEHGLNAGSGLTACVDIVSVE